MKRSGDALTRQCGLILDGFAETLGTKGAFYLRFCTLAPMERAALTRFWDLDPEDAWAALGRLWRFFDLGRRCQCEDRSSLRHTWLDGWSCMPIGSPGRSSPQ